MGKPCRVYLSNANHWNMGLTMTTLKALETSLYWQQVVLKQSTDPKQKARVRLAIEKLTAQINQLKA